jgi:hypothetical protein
MPEPSTLRPVSGLRSTPASLTDSAFIMIDCQNTYTQGVMALDVVAAALDEAATLLRRARSAGIHIKHDAGEGSPYDIAPKSARSSTKWRRCLRDHRAGCSCDTGLTSAGRGRRELSRAR